MIALSRVELAHKAVFIAPPLSAATWPGTFARAMGLPNKLTRRFHERIEARLAMPPEALDARLLSPRGPLDLLVMHDADDAEVPLDDGRAVARAWNAARFVETHGLGHRRILRSRDTAREVVRFLTGYELESGLEGLERELFYRDLRRVA